MANRIATCSTSRGCQLREAAVRTKRSYDLANYGQTHGGRPLGVVVVSRPDHQSDFDSIVKQRQAWVFDEHLSDNGGNGSIQLSDKLPSVAWMGYSIHGDESSGVNASLLVLYLGSAEGAWIDGILDRHVLLIDPSLNPDGIDRFAQWVNDHRGQHPSADPADLEHQQAWPTRTIKPLWI